MAPQVTRQHKSQARKLRAHGMTLTDITKTMGRSPGGIRLNIVGIKKGSAPTDLWAPAPGRLQEHEREQIAIRIARGESLSSIARELGGQPRW